METTCPTCHAAVAPGSSFCTRCGSVLGVREIAPDVGGGQQWGGAPRRDRRARGAAGTTPPPPAPAQVAQLDAAWRQVSAAPQAAAAAYASPLGPAFDGVSPAGAGRRVAAYAIDVAVAAVVAGAVWWFTRSWVYAGLAAAEVAAGLVVWEARSGRTVGNVVLGLRSAQDHLPYAPGLWRSVVRAGVLAVGHLGLGLGQWLVVASSAFDGSGRRQGWHDKLAGTVVVDIRDLRREEAPVAFQAPVVTGADIDGMEYRVTAPKAPPPPPLRTAPTSPPPPPAATTARAATPVSPPPPPATTPVEARAAASPPPPPASVATPRATTAPAATARAATPPVPPPPATTRAEARAAASPPPPPAAPARTDAPMPTPTPTPPPPPAEVAAAASTPPPPPAAAARSYVVTLDDGRAMTVSGPGYVGRRPQAPAGERVDHVIEIEDPGRSLSRTHARFGIDDNGFFVEDNGSANGTAVLSADGSAVRGAPGERLVVPPGGTVRLGDRTFTVRPYA